MFSVLLWHFVTGLIGFVAMKFKINHPANPKYPSQVEITPRLMHQSAGYKCDVGGQLTVEWSRATQGKTATLEFRLTSM